MTHSERKPRVDKLVPTVAVDWKLARIHVGTPDDEVERLIVDAVRNASAADSRWNATLERQTVRYALWRHHKNLADYQAVMSGARKRRYVPAAYLVK